jgi:hypothetical protein
MLGYVAAGHSAGEFYPFSPLGMFNEVRSTASRLAIRDAEGQILEIARFTGFHCAAPLDFGHGANLSCGDTGYSAYDAIARDYIVSHPGVAGEGESIAIIRRVFRIQERLGPVAVHDCALIECTAKRAVGAGWTPRL